MASEGRPCSDTLRPLLWMFHWINCRQKAPQGLPQTLTQRPLPRLPWSSPQWTPPRLGKQSQGEPGLTPGMIGWGNCLPRQSHTLKKPFMGRRQPKAVGTIVHHSVPSLIRTSFFFWGGDLQNNEEHHTKAQPSSFLWFNRGQGTATSFAGPPGVLGGEECLESPDLGTKYRGQMDRFQTHFQFLSSTITGRVLSSQFPLGNVELTAYTMDQLLGFPGSPTHTRECQALT